MVCQKPQLIVPIALILGTLFMLAGCVPRKNQYTTFADYPGFKEYYVSRCSSDQSHRTAAIVDQNLLEQFQPRLVLPPGGGEISYDLAFPPRCDPFYTAKIMLGSSRPFLSRFYIGRDGPPDSDY